MIFWLLVALAAAPILMAACVFLMLRNGAIRRLHEQSDRKEEEPRP